MEKQHRDYRVVLVSDIHIDKRNRLQDRIYALNQVSEYVNDEENGIDLFVDLGDTFERANPTEEERLVYSNFNKKILIRKQKIGGNHETIDNIIFAYESNLGFADETSDIRWFYPIEKQDGNFFFPDKSVAFIFCNYGAEYKISAIVNKILEEDSNTKIYFFGHCTVNGAKTNSGYKLRNDAIDATTFAPFEFAFLGDIHKRQMYKNWGYVGALVKRDAGEAGNADGFTVVTIHEDGGFSQEFIEIDGRDYITIEFEEELLVFPKNVTLKNNIVKIILTGSSAWIATLDIDEIRNSAMKYNPYKVSFERNSTDVKERESISENLSEEEQLKEYCKTNEVDENTTNKGFGFLTEHLKQGV